MVLCSWYLQFFNCRNLVNSWHWERLLVSNPQQRRCISHPLIGYIGYIFQLMAHSLLLFLRCNNCLRLCSMSWLELEFCCTGVRAISLWLSKKAHFFDFGEGWEVHMRKLFDKFHVYAVQDLCNNFDPSRVVLEQLLPVFSCDYMDRTR